jgi:acyl-CoA reductase-like NAD-dependent aldehyde dehydrogenase
MKVVNPATEEVIREVTEDSVTSVTSKFKTLSNGQLAWQAQSLQKRIEVLQRFSDLLETDRNAIVKTLTSEVGKPIQQSINEVNGARSRIKWLTENALKYLSEEKMTIGEGLEETISYEPLGVICNISAWNYPYLVGVNVIVPALLAGNAVMYKPSEYSTLTGLEIERLLKLAGVPDEVFQTAVGGKETGEALLNLPFDGYFFTGSYKTGHHIYNKVAGKMVPCQLELGGKDPLYVADDVADVKSVAAATADGAFYNNGQSCCAVERIYVHEKIYDRYVDEFLKEVKSWKKGSPTEEGVYIGPVTRREQLNLLVEHVADANSKGAVIATGGHRINQKGFYFEPTVLLNVDHSMRVMREESFGPIIGIMKVKSDDEAAQLMNDTDYGLTASVYSSSEERAKKMLSKMHSGTAYWNCCDRVSAAVPWSGRKNSGIGATLSHIGLRAFTHPKAYHLKRS